MDGEGTDEILALEAIYESELKIEDLDGGKKIGITIYPATADDPTSQYVCLDLSFILPQKYPSEPPKLLFTKSRGLSDVSLDEIKHKMHDLLKERAGDCVLFDLLEIAKDTLTCNNIPSCLCSICLSGFQEGDDFLKTECFHYFHCYCLNDYKTHMDSDIKEEAKTPKSKNSAPTPSETTVPCPVCRLSVSLDMKSIREANPPLDNTNCEIHDKHLLKSQREKFDKIYRKQLKNGGLIDLEYEQNKFLLSNIQQAYERQKTSLAQAEGKGREDERKQQHAKETEANRKARTLSLTGEKEKYYHQPAEYRNKKCWKQNHSRGSRPRSNHVHDTRNAKPSQFQNGHGYGKNPDRKGTGHRNNNHIQVEKGENAGPSSSHNSHSANGKSNEKIEQSDSINKKPSCNNPDGSAHQLRTSENSRRYYGPRLFGKPPQPHGGRSKN